MMPSRMKSATMMAPEAELTWSPPAGARSRIAPARGRRARACRQLETNENDRDRAHGTLLSATPREESNRVPEPEVNHDGHIVRLNSRAADGWGTQIGGQAVTGARERRRFDTVVGAL